MLLGNRYLILKKLGEGGCGEVFLAEDIHLPSKPRCVIKQLKPSFANPATYSLLKKKFKEEAKILEMVGKHDQIPEVYAYFEEADETYIAEQWFEGLTLAQKVKQDGVFDSNFVRDFLVCILPVIANLHSKGIIHRDIKPSNIILRIEDGMPVLIDFGSIKDTEATVLSRKGEAPITMVLSTGYTAPEQAAGSPEEVSDLFSLGRTAVFMLTGKNPSTISTKEGKLNWTPDAHSNSLHTNLVETINKAIEPEIKDRFRTALDMVQAVYYGTDEREVTWVMQPRLYTPYMWKCRDYINSRRMVSYYEQSMKLHPTDSGEYQRGLIWKVTGENLKRYKPDWAASIHPFAHSQSTLSTKQSTDSQNTSPTKPQGTTVRIVRRSRRKSSE